MVNLTRNLKDRGTTTIIHRSIYLCAHGCEREEAIVLPNVFHKLITAGITIKPSQRSKGLRTRSKGRYANLATLTTAIINDPTTPDR